MGLKFFDLFAGIGGFRLGMERAGHECVGSCEWDKYARETYKKNFGSYPEYNDAKNMSLTSQPYFDVLCAGFPCQAFSIAGKRLGFEDTRGTIFFEIARIAKEKRPRYLFLENVKGLLSHDNGETFRVIISTLDEMGYDAEWQVLNSKYFVPQNRERIFIIGHLRGERTRQVFPLGDDDPETTREIESVGVVNDRKGLRDVDNATCLDANYWKGYDQHGARTMIKDCREKDTETFVALTEKRTDEAKQIRSKMLKDGKDWCPRRGKELVPRDDDIGNCVTAGQSKEGFVSNGVRIRRLTPVECERLQGFPDNWTQGVSDTQRYKQCGNAVTVNVVEYIAKNFSKD